MLNSLNMFSKYKRWLIFGISCIFLYTILGFFVLPLVVKSQMIKILSENLKRRVSVEEVKVNPYAMSLTVLNLSIDDIDGKPFASLEAFYVNLQLSSALKRALVVKNLHVKGPYARLIRNSNGDFNFADLTTPSGEEKKEKENKKTPPFLIRDITIQDGRLLFLDRQKQVEHELTDIRFTLPFISSLPKDAQTDIEPDFSAKLDHSTISVSGKTRPFDRSMQSNFNINIERINIPKYHAYLPIEDILKIPSGYIKADTHLAFSKAENETPSLVLSGNVFVNQLEVFDYKDHLLIKIPEFKVAAAPSDVLANKIRLSQILCRSPELNIKRDESGKVNFLTLIPEKRGETTSEDSHSSGNTLSLIVDQITLTGGRVDFTDISPVESFATTLSPVELTVSKFNTQKNSEANFTLLVKTESDEIINCEGNFSLDPLRAQGTIDLKGIPLTKYRPYYQDLINFHVVDGSVGLKTGYRYHAGSDEPIMEIHMSGLSLDSLKLEDSKRGELFFSVPKLSVENMDLDLNSQTVTVGSLGSRGGFLLCRRAEDGVLNLVQHFVPPGSPTVETVPEEPPKAATPWEATLNNVFIENYTLQFQDQSPADPVNITLDKVTLEAKGISTRKDQTAHTSLAMRWGQKGGLAIKGPVVIQPLSANLDVLVDHFDIRSIQPYFTDRVKLIITDGNFNADGEVNVSPTAQGSPSIRYQGKTWILNFSSIDKKENNDFVKYESLYLSGMDIGLNPTRIIIDEVSFNGYYNQLTINPDGTVNVNTVLPFGQDQSEKTSEKSQTPEAGPEKKALPEIRINTVNLQGGTIKFSDKLTKPNFETDLLQLGGRISGLSSDERARADVFLKGVQDNYSPLEIKGKINPLAEELFADIMMSFKDIELSPYSAYSGKYLGYILEKGKLNLDLEYKVAEKKLNAKNLVYIDQLTLGDKVDSPDATSLPVKLGIALLKDRDDRIILDIPVTGNLDDPEFSIGKVIWKMIGNLFTKIITSPFAAISSLFGGGEELSFVDFGHGSVELTESAKEKINNLVNALFERPALNLEIEGEVNPNKDREGLRNNQFHKLLKVEKIKEMAIEGHQVEAIDQVSIATEEYEHYLSKAYEGAEFPKPRDEKGRIKDLPPSEKEKLLITNIVVTDDDLRLLAHDRASKVKEFILEPGKVASQRIFVVEPRSIYDEADKEVKNSRVNFRLK